MPESEDLSRKNPVKDYQLDPDEAKIIEDLREKKRKEIERRERDTKRRDEISKIMKGDTWTTKHGAVLKVAEMTPDHALKTWRMIIGYRWNGKFFLEHEMTEGWHYHSPGEWPLSLALLKRSQDKPTLRDRWADRKSLKVFEAKKKA